MEFYQINDLERLSGIKAHTIRIWEKRYEVISPYRSETNIRYYDDAQLKKLLNISTLIALGYKISRVAAMTEEEIREQILSRQADVSNASAYNLFVNDLIQSMLDFDEWAFERIFSQSVEKFGVPDAFVEVIYPFLYKTGILWSVNETMPVQEHFASNLVRRKLHTLTEQLARPEHEEKKFLLFLPADEWHEIGLLLANYLIRQRGYPVVYLGQNVPFSELDYVLKKTEATHLLTFLVSDDHPEYLNSLQTLLKQGFKRCQLLISGPGYRLEHCKEDKQSTLLFQVKDLLKFI